MTVELSALIEPGRTALVTMELQRGVVGDLSPMRELVEAAAVTGVVANASRLARAARGAGGHVVHCTFEARPDGAGAAVNAPLLRALAEHPLHLVAGTEAVELVPELGPEPPDVVCARRHGLTPFPGTDLDQTLRNLGVHTVVATGVSVNVGVAGLVMGAVDRGYEVVIVTDAVAGVPAEYATAALAHSLAMLATPASTDEIVAVWAP